MSWGKACGPISLGIQADARQEAVLARAPALLYSLGMSAKVIIVQRPRRSLFAIPRALPDWFRSVWVALFRPSIRNLGVATADSNRSRPINTPLFPRLVFEASGSHRCVGCALCVRVCPSNCLSLGTEGEGRALRVTRFEIASGACVGCGLCDEACPERAIEMVPGARVELAPLSGRLAVADLLIDRSAIHSTIDSTRSEVE